jgi:cbb3-type cytochrome oxidase subunit 3
MSPAKKYAYAWITIAFFLISIVGHWITARCRN